MMAASLANPKAGRCFERDLDNEKTLRLQFFLAPLRERLFGSRKGAKETPKPQRSLSNQYGFH
ncbi:MAG: hypothetical protein QOI77_316 [Blastocatellia bacterium]|jgi:hypothetical protein|nr:hypothetical protein [Blastocatellia bacterium]